MSVKGGPGIRLSSLPSIDRAHRLTHRTPNRATPGTLIVAKFCVRCLWAWSMHVRCLWAWSILAHSNPSWYSRGLGKLQIHICFLVNLQGALFLVPGARIQVLCYWSPDWPMFSFQFSYDVNLFVNPCLHICIWCNHKFGELWVKKMHLNTCRLHNARGFVHAIVDVLNTGTTSTFELNYPKEQLTLWLGCCKVKFLLPWH